jgi:hypothetical protein|tara:strand:+ start:601 stop:789 length:189 start_codon:yes stop_codon:yes gene_type:complete
MPKFSKIKRRSGQSIGSSPGGSPKFKSSSGGKAVSFKTPTYKKVKRLKPSYSTYKNRNYRGD